MASATTHLRETIHRSPVLRQSIGLATRSDPLVRLSHVFKTYDTPSGPFPALTDVSLEARAGEFVVVMGRSGSGKTTFLNLLAGIDRPTAGEIQVGGVAVHALPESRLAAWRGRTVGLVFQFFQLLPTLTVAENVMLPMDFCNTYPGRVRRARALELLERVGIADQADKFPASLSGGKQQRTAIARALANDPSVLVADEPTGNLDSHTAAAVQQLFKSVAAEGKAIIMVTHDAGATHFATRQITIQDGRIIGDRRAESGRSEQAEVAR
jgi:putative ABC transport system ATP-binding protein